MRLRIHLHLDLTVQASGDGGLGDSVELLQPPAEDRLGRLLGRPEIGASGHRDRHDGLGLGIHPEDPWPGGALGKGVSRMLSSRSRTLSMAKSMSVPQEKRRVTRLTPSRDTEVTFSTPGTAATWASTRSVTRRSTSAGATSG